MTLPAVFYVPRLHEQCIPARLSACALPVPCGLRKKDDLPEIVRKVYERFPFSPAQARAVLEDMLRLGEERSCGDILKPLAILEQMRKGLFAEKSDELAAVEAFADSDVLPPLGTRGKTPALEEEQRAALVDCQKFLLLAYALEEKIFEMSCLESRLALASASLQAALGEEDEFPELPLETTLFPEPAESTVPAPWRAVVEAALAFLPENSILLTADQDMIRDLDEENLLKDLPPEYTEPIANWPPALLRDLRHVRLPAWRLAGGKTPSSSRPWLNREYDVLAAGTTPDACGD